MIKAEELRLGNIVKMPSSGELTKITAMDISDIQSNLKNRLPVHISEEMLLKVGFEKTPHFTVMGALNFDLGRNRSLSIGCSGTPNEMLFLREGDGKPDDDLIVLHNFDYDGKLYLHKLQNIVSIFGQELNTAGLI